MLIYIYRLTNFSTIKDKKPELRYCQKINLVSASCHFYIVLIFYLIALSSFDFSLSSLPSFNRS